MVQEINYLPGCLLYIFVLPQPQLEIEREQWLCTISDLMAVSVHMPDQVNEVNCLVGPVRYRPYPGSDLFDMVE
jgi:hypothetical protein